MVWAVSSVVNGVSSQNASNAQQQAAVAAGQQQYTEFQQQQANLAPYLQSGTQNLAALNSAMPDLTKQFTMQDFQSNPGYQFQLQQGEQGMQRSAAAAGMLNSTGTQQNLNNYAQGMANTDYQQALTNFQSSQQQRYTMMSGMANMGLSATNSANQSSANFANNYGNTLMAGGNAQAAGDIAMGNAITGGVSGLGSQLPSNFYNNLLGGGGGSNPTSGMTNAVGANGGNAGMTSWAGADGGAAAAGGGASSMDAMLIA